MYSCSSLDVSSEVEVASRLIWSVFSVSESSSSAVPHETRLSLLVRLRDRSDEGAWREFVELYRPVIWRLARHRGLQSADADDLTQQVLAAVAKAIDRWEPDPRRGKFRTWLHRIACNCLVNSLTRGRRERGTGDTDVLELLAEQAARPAVDPALIEFEYRREVFVRAAERVRGEFQPETWQAFWRTAVGGEEPAEVARSLGRGLGAVYAARGRVMRRLRDVVAQWEIDDEDSPNGM